MRRRRRGIWEIKKEIFIQKKGKGKGAQYLQSDMDIGNVIVT